LLFGFPIFFDAGLVVFLPIILTVARRFGGSLLFYALPAAGAFAAMHAIVPPHPGPVAAAEVLGADIGLTLLVGVPVAVVSWYVGVLLVSRVLGARVDVSVPDALFGEMNDGHDSDDEQDDRHGSGSRRTTKTRAVPAFSTVLGILLLPLVLISFNTVLATLISAGTLEEGQGWVDFLMLLGETGPWPTSAPSSTRRWGRSARSS
jgi:GntP family gluconate:H+ symporter